MKNVHIFYHIDTDGKAAGFFAMEYFRNSENIPDENIMLYPINYSYKIYFDGIESSDTVVIVDFSFEPTDMNKVLEITDSVIWIDHHVTAIKKYDNKFPDNNFAGIRHIGLSGAMLTWIYFNKLKECSCDEGRYTNIELTAEDAISCKKAAPLFLQLVNDHDIWEYTFKDSTADFQTYVRAVPSEPNDPIWKGLLIDSARDINDSQTMLYRMITSGHTMNIYKASFESDYVKRLSFDVMFEGHLCRAVNLALCNSSVFDSVKNDKYDMYITFSYNGNMYNYSLYSDKLDVSEIAAKYGGGGHRGAAGFRTSKFVLINHDVQFAGRPR